MEAAQYLAWLNKGTAVVDVVSLDFSRLKLFQWCPGIGEEAIALVSAVIFFLKLIFLILNTSLFY